MKIAAIASADAPACRLSSSAFGVSVCIHGLEAAQLRFLFGAQGRPFPWNSGSIREPITVELEAPDEPANEPGMIELPDGQVHYRSGGAAEIRVSSRHHEDSDRFPSSLNLAIAQQWARAGLIPLHAAGVVVDDHGHVFIGDKGSGKSTLAAALLASGERVVTDDWMLFGAASSGEIVMERMRGFLMLRQSRASEQLLHHLPDDYRNHGTRPRHTRSTGQPDPRLPVLHPVDGLWSLQRDRVRPERTRVQPATASAGMAWIMANSMPILFSGRFPHEQNALLAGLAPAIAGLRLAVMHSGIDILPTSDKASPVRDLIRDSVRREVDEIAAHAVQSSSE